MKRKTYIESGALFHVIDSGEEFHSFRDLNLVLGPFVLKPTKPKISLLDIEGMDGSLDLTEANGEVKYYDRELTFTFSVFPQDDLTFEERQSIVSNAINGKRCKITLDKDPDYYFTGRCVVNEYLCDKRLCQIVVIATVAPYKMMHHETVVQVELTGAGQAIILMNKRKSVHPVITTTANNVKVTFKESEYTLKTAGTYTATTHSELLNLQLKEGANILTVSGNGTITFTYREGEL